MPIYEYTCDQCQRDCELLMRGNELPVCPACGSKQLVKRLSVTAAPSVQGNSLPTAGPCGRPECGMGGCQGF
jgi:putative FmdB family regulatory protein